MAWWGLNPKNHLACLIVASVILARPGFAQTNSVLASGTWYKLAVARSGVHRLDVGYLRNMGLDLASLDPKNLQLYGNGGSMLPQSNAAPRPNDLIQNAIMVTGEADGRFNDTDAIYFYAEGPHVVLFDSAQNTFFHQINHYADSSYYFLRVGSQPGRRVADLPSVDSGAKPLERFTDYWYHEKESVNLLQSGREWWGEYLGLSGQLRLSADLPGVVPGSAATMRGAGIASAQVTTRLRWQVNGQEVGEQTQGAVSTYRYDLKAQRSEKGYDFTVGTNPPASFGIELTFDKNGQNSATAYLDYAALQVERQLRAYPDQQLYRFLPNLRDSVSYLLKSMPADWQWWDVSDPRQPGRAALNRQADGTATFGNTGARRLHTYAGFSPEQAYVPVSWQQIDNQNLHALATPDLLIVTSPSWLAEATRLARFRTQHDGLSVAVVTTDQVFNEFASGHATPTAIRDLVRRLFLQDPQKLKYLLLFGDATYDYKNRGGAQSAAQQRQWVPVYESRESLHPVFTYSSDDYFGFLQENEGEWPETLSGDAPLDIGIGRLPVKSVDEARVVVDKLIHYGSSPHTLGAWRNRVSFVADDGDGNIHQQHADLLARQIEGQLLTKRLFVDAFARVAAPEGAKVPSLNTTIRQRIDDGTLILNYTGHGGASGWAEEQILTLADMQAARGYDNMPLLLTATCEFGRYDDPALVSGAELMVLSPRGAAIGALTTTRPVFSSTNFSLNTAFYQALAAGGSMRLGDLMKHTKNNSLSGSLNRNFALLGDPSMPLARAAHDVAWTAQTDTLSALKKVALAGEIRLSGTPAPDGTFDGRASVTVYDKPVAFRTNGAGGAATEYRELRNKLYEGDVSVRKGRFKIEFVVPRNIDYQLGAGRVSVYAIRRDSLADAAGQLAVTVGGATSIAADRTPPQVRAYLGDSSFQNGQTVPPNTILWIETFDESGIDITARGLGQSLTATLNDSITYVLNDYYRASPDDFRRGTIRFPFTNLPPGQYQLKIKIWDSHTNAAEQTLRFTVGLAAGVTIDEAILYPNPFKERISFKINHNRAGEDIFLTFKIVNMSGQLVQTFQKTYYNSEPTLTETLVLGSSGQLAPSENVPYLYEVEIRSTKDQTTDRHVGRLLHRP